MRAKRRTNSDYLVLPKEVETDYIPMFIKLWVSAFYKKQAIKLAKDLANLKNKPFHVIEGGKQWLVMNRREIKNQQKHGLISKTLSFQDVNNLSVYTAKPTK